MAEIKKLVITQSVSTKAPVPIANEIPAPASDSSGAPKRRAVCSKDESGSQIAEVTNMLATLTKSVQQLQLGLTQMHVALGDPKRGLGALAERIGALERLVIPCASSAAPMQVVVSKESEEIEEKLVVAPLPRNVHPVHNAGRRKARASAILRQIQNDKVEASFVDAAEWILEEIGLAPNDLACNAQLPREMREKLVVAPLPRNVHPVHNAGRRKARAFLLPRSACCASSSSVRSRTARAQNTFWRDSVKRTAISVHRTLCLMFSSKGLHSLTSRSRSKSWLFEKRRHGAAPVILSPCFYASRLRALDTLILFERPREAVYVRKKRMQRIEVTCVRQTSARPLCSAHAP
ncbi:hypothetical protein HPB50_029603 [Hyalomma asiaticum]|nr:hypothetical protein HPB50_029603 [Hyalomma asiaticum]